MKLANRCKRLFSALLAAVLVLSALPTAAYAAEDSTICDHAYEAVVTAPTCTTDGYTTYVCDCGASYIADTVDALGHCYTVVTTKPTCTTDGNTIYVCDCGESYVGNVLAAVGHSYTAVTTKPSCTEEGKTVYTCHCGESYTELIPATGEHAYEAVTTKPTCVKDGYTVYTCDCGASYTELIPATGEHAYEAVTTAPTCVKDGYTVYTCDCGASYTKRIPANGVHAYEAAVTAPTCTADGYTTYVCDCGASYIADTVAAFGHVYTTAEADGCLVYTCLTCGHSYSEELTTKTVYKKVSPLGKTHFVVTLVSGGRYYALSHADNKLSAVQVAVSNSVITGEVSEDLIWTYEDSVLSYESEGETYYLYAQSAGRWLSRLSAPTLTVSTSQSTAVSLSSNRLKLDGYYLRYSNGAISLNRSGTTAYLFAETVIVDAPL